MMPIREIEDRLDAILNAVEAHKRAFDALGEGTISEEEYRGHLNTLGFECLQHYFARSTDLPTVTAQRVVFVATKWRHGVGEARWELTQGGKAVRPSHHVRQLSQDLWGGAVETVLLSHGRLITTFRTAARLLVRASLTRPAAALREATR